MRRTDPEMLAKIQQAFADGGDRRPPLYQWMSRHYEDLVEMFDGARLNWTHLTASFRDGGFVNGAGGELQPEIVRQTWYRVRKRKAAVRTRRASRQPASIEVLSPPAPVIRPPQTHSATPTPSIPPADAMAELMAEMNHRSGRT